MNYSAHKPMFFFWQFVSIDSYSLGKICPGRLGVKIQSTNQNFTDLFRTSNIQQILSKAILKDSQHMSLGYNFIDPLFAGCTACNDSFQLKNGNKCECSMYRAWDSTENNPCVTTCGSKPFNFTSKQQKICQSTCLMPGCACEIGYYLNSEGKCLECSNACTCQDYTKADNICYVQSVCAIRYDTSTKVCSCSDMIRDYSRYSLASICVQKSKCQLLSIDMLACITSANCTSFARGYVSGSQCACDTTRNYLYDMRSGFLSNKCILMQDCENLTGIYCYNRWKYQSCPLNQFISVDQYSCVSDCSKGETKNGNSCVCAQNFQLSGKKCVLTQCVSGFIDITLKNCVDSCRTPIYAVSPDNKSCVCGQNYTYSLKLNMCVLKTQKCAYGWILSVRNQCIDICPTDQQLNTDSSACVCSKDTYYDFDLNKCVSSCEYYLQKDTGELTCSKLGDFGCSYYQTYYNGNMCINNCDGVVEQNMCTQNSTRSQLSTTVIILITIIPILSVLIIISSFFLVKSKLRKRSLAKRGTTLQDLVKFSVSSVNE
ncbi:Growth_factor receptor cysteine-rich domain superfamily [Hexamita inflata]|uniref:Growth factor receptor cysteine-rich domain superfamily n=1 Tax=Hexamita inflata TaxID=28002 RepID=A0AA86PIV3_9EUKA|nr:Growth factor receptor cysteine-rich domain superfamily [Hexamita inflata]